MHEHDIVVSVIVLAYNHERYIRQTLDSILMQQVPFRYEILVGDDCSGDNTSAILRRYAERYPDIIRAYIREENVGATKNAYDLLMKAQGKYLAFCEGDDFWTDEQKLATQVRFLEAHPEFIGCSHRCRIVDENGQPRENQTLSWVRERACFTLDDFKGIYLPGQTATIVKRNIFLDKQDSYSFLYTLNKNISDRTTTLLYLTKGPFACLPQCMSAYRQVRGAGITNQVYQSNPSRILHELEYTDQLNTLAATLTEKTGIFKAYYRQLYAWAVWQYLKQPSRENRHAVALTAQRIGAGSIHPLAFLRGMLEKIGWL